MKSDTILLTSSYEKKLLFTEILSKSLGHSKFTIDASFVWEEKNRVLVAITEGEDTLRLGINLNFKENPMFSNCPHAKELTVYYRAFFIESFVRLLESLDVNVPTDYFSGLVHMEVITAISDSEKIVCRSIDNLALRKNISLSDIHCTIQAVTRILIGFSDRLDATTVKTCKTFLDSLLDFSTVPETVYVKSYNPAFSFVVVLDGLKKVIERRPQMLQRFALLNAINLTENKQLSFASLENACEVSENPVWFGVYARMLANSGSNKPSERLVSQEGFGECIIRIKENYVSFFQQYQCNENNLMSNNLEAIKILSRGINSMFGQLDLCESGVLHYY